jgi:hypothetical protein
MAALEELTSLDPAPAYIRSDSRPEFIAQALREWCDTITTAYFEPGSAWDNGYIESYDLRSTASTTAGSVMSS